MAFFSSPSRLWMLALGWVILGILIGVTIGGLFWWVWLAQIGKSISEAVRGEVDDGIGTLQGMTALGGLVGCAVGLLYSLGKIANRWCP